MASSKSAKRTAKRRRARERALALPTADVVEAGPTPETLKKLRADVIEKLRHAGRLGNEQVQAAEEIRIVWQAFGRGMFPQASFRTTGVRDSLRAHFRDPIDRLTRKEELVWRQRYKPWSLEFSGEIARAIRGGDEGARRQANSDPSQLRVDGRIVWIDGRASSTTREERLTRLQLTLDIVIDNLGPRQAERYHGLRHGAAVPILQEALLRYAEIAGWIVPQSSTKRVAS